MESRESDSSTSLRRGAMNADTISADQGTRTTAVVAGHDCLNANELAAYLRVNRKTVYAYAGSGSIPCARLGRRLVFRALRSPRGWRGRPFQRRRRLCHDVSCARVARNFTPMFSSASRVQSRDDRVIVGG